MQSLVFSKHLYEVYKSFKTGTRALLQYGHVKSAFEGVAMLESLRNALHTMFTAFEAAKHEGVVVIELPFAGLGLEASGYVARGTMYVSNSSDSGLREINSRL